MRRGGLVLLLLLLGACASSETVPSADLTNLPPAPAPSPPQFPAEPTLADVIARVETTPLMAARAADIRSAEALADQAGRPPNPVVGVFGEKVDFEDLGGGVQKRGLRVQERFETAGKREARVDVAEGRIAESGTALRAARIRLAEQATAAHQRALAGRRLTAARAEELRVAERLLALEEKSVAAGRGVEAPVVALRETAGRIRVALAGEDAERRGALRGLEGLLALPPGSIGGVRGKLLTVAALPAPEEWGENPEVATLTAMQRTAKAKEREARAKAWPDVTAGLGLESGRDSGEHRTTVGFSVEAPIPVLDSNEGAIRAAAADRVRIREELRGAQAAAAAELLQHREMALALDRSRRALADEVLPAITRELAIARASRAAGRSDERAVARVELRLAQTRRELIELERAVAGHVAEALGVAGRTAPVPSSEL